jgi:hypothetical protein
LGNRSIWGSKNPSFYADFKMGLFIRSKVRAKELEFFGKSLLDEKKTEGQKSLRLSL